MYAFALLQKFPLPHTFHLFMKSLIMRKLSQQIINVAQRTALHTQISL